MNPSIRRFTLDTNATRSQISIPVTLNDTGRIWHITLTEGGLCYRIEDGCIAVLSVKRPNGSYFEDVCPVLKNVTIVYDFSQNEKTAAVEGIHDCEVTIFGANNTILTSATFTMVVGTRAVSSDDITITDNDRTIIDYCACEEVKRQAREIHRISAESERISAEELRNSAEEERAEAEAEREAFWGNKAAVYLGGGEMPEGYNVQIDIDGDDVFPIENGSGKNSVKQTGETEAQDIEAAAFNRKTKAYGGGSFASGGGTIAGVSYATFLTLFGLVDDEVSKALYEAARERSANTIDVATPEEAGYSRWFATARGELARAYARGSDASGHDTETWADFSHVGGIKSKISKEGKGSRVDGNDNKNYAPFSNIDGSGNTNRAKYGDIAGCGNISDEGCEAVHIEGMYNRARKKALYGHLEGIQNILDASGGHVENYLNELYAPNASVGGSRNVVEETAGNSFTRGYGNRTRGPNQFVRGVWSAPNSLMAEIVGHGTGENNRFNIYEMDWNGNAWYTGDVYARGSKKLVTVEFMMSVIKSLAEAAGLSDFEIPEES